MKTGEEVRVGLVGLDMSHAPEFARRMNDPRDPEYVAGGRVVVGWPGGSADWELSRSRVEKFTARVRDEYGVRIVSSPEEVAEAVDLVLITAADGRAHRGLFERVVGFGKPVFVEKPVATTSADARWMFQVAAEAATPLMSCSTARFGGPLWDAVGDEALGKVVGCEVFGPMPEQEPQQPGLLWYGVHSVEVMNVIMGRGCAEVRAVRTDGTDVMVATWADGRVGTFRGTRTGEWRFGATIHREKGFQFVDLKHNSWFGPTIELMLTKLARGESPVAAADTVEVVRICEAANESRAGGGVAVRV